ncbi:hypothetical protein I4U23_003899 [Adineta vaga]|nr:hypothetical protein I4U23_003899 [Adineta vaga]
MANKIKVWVKINDNEPEKVEIQSDSDIDDLKNEIFIDNKEEKRKYYGIFNNERLLSSSHVPNDSTGERPILFVRIDETHNEINTTFDLDTTPTITINLNDDKNNELSTTFLTTNTPTINTSIHPHPPHLVRTMHYENGDKYVGEINMKEEPHGKGTMSWKNGRRYEGQFINGKKDGEGIEYGANGAVNFSGIWKDDVYVSLNDNSDP